MVSDTAVRVRPGHEGTLVNLCARGALIALRRPMPPGISVDLQLSTGDARIATRALVLRCSVRAIAALEGVTYEAALRFDETCVFERARTAPDGYQVPDGSDAIAVADVSVLPAHESSRPAPASEIVK
jgi:hypothetical protein